MMGRMDGSQRATSTLSITSTESILSTAPKSPVLCAVALTRLCGGFAPCAPTKGFALGTLIWDRQGLTPYFDPSSMGCPACKGAKCWQRSPYGLSFIL